MFVRMLEITEISMKQWCTINNVAPQLTISSDNEVYFTLELRSASHRNTNREMNIITPNDERQENTEREVTMIFSDNALISTTNRRTRIDRNALNEREDDEEDNECHC